jgi:GNAT superfamily N-acetyltransferase
VITVWRATHGDADAVTGLLVEFRDHMGHSWPPDESFAASVRKLIGRADGEFWLAATEPGATPSAVCQLRFRHSVWTATEDCWLEDLYVRDQARRRGLARALVERAIDHARDRGCRRVELDATEDNIGALALYARLGFSDTSKGGSRSLCLGLRLDAPATAAADPPRAR